jgi:hypothetical protein
MAGAHLVITICKKEHCASTVNASSEELKQIQGRLICPMHVLKHHERRRAVLELIQSCSEDNLSIASATDCVQQRSFSLPGDVVEGRKGPGREQRVADTP